MIQSKKYTAGTSQNHVDIYQQKMIAMVNQIKKGCIISKCKQNTAVYYKVTNDLSGCTKPVIAKQSKTFELEYIGTGAKAIRNINRAVFYFDDIYPYAQMELDKSRAKYVTYDELKCEGWTDEMIELLPEPLIFLDDPDEKESEPVKMWSEIDVYPL